VTVRRFKWEEVRGKLRFWSCSFCVWFL